MNSYVHSHLQQRKSSLAHLTKNSQSRQSLNKSNENKNQTSSNHLRQSLCSNICNTEEIQIQKQSFPLKNHKKEINQTNHAVDSSLAKSKGKVQEQQNEDYIRNLYKKYLGKQNKEPSERINAYTERKLRTTESRQILTSNTGVKDFTKRALFKDKDQEIIIQNEKRNPKTKELIPQYQQAERHCEAQKSQAISQSRVSLKTKKPSTKKNQKQNLTDRQKTDTKKYKSKQKGEKITNEKDKENKPQTLKRSESTRIRPSQLDKNGGFQNQRQKLWTEVECLSQQKEKIKIRQKISDGIVHPHRESYCQFDTEQETTKVNNTSQETASKYQQLISKSTHERGPNRQILTGDLCQFVDAKIFKNASQLYLGQTEDLELFLGSQNSLVKTLKRISNVKQLNAQKSSNQRRENGSRQGRTLIC